MYICISDLCIYICMCIYIYRERERDIHMYIFFCGESVHLQDQKGQEE